MTRRLNQCDEPGCDAPRQEGARFCAAHLDAYTKAQEAYEASVNELLTPAFEKAVKTAEGQRAAQICSPAEQVAIGPTAMPTPSRHGRPYFPTPVAGGYGMATSEICFAVLATETLHPDNPEVEIRLCNPKDADQVFVSRFRCHLDGSPLDYERVLLHRIEQEGHLYMDERRSGIPLTHYIAWQDSHFMPWKIWSSPRVSLRHSLKTPCRFTLIGEVRLARSEFWGTP